MKRSHLLLGIGAGVGLFALLAASSDRSKTVGGAVMPGDEALIPVLNLPSGTILPGTVPPTGFVVMRVSGVVSGSLTGPIVAFVSADGNRTTLPLATPPVQIPRSLATTITRGGRRIA